MRSLISTILLVITISTLFLYTCAQRDNQHDPLSPLFSTSLPQLDIAITDIDKSRITKKFGDTLFIVLSPVKVSFKATGYDTENKDSLSVLLKIIHNEKLVDLYENITSIDSDLNDSGVTTYVFETVSKDKKATQKKIKFIINPDIQPRIDSFNTEPDTVRIGRNIDAMFTLNIVDSALLLDSVKYICMSNVRSKHIKNKKLQLYDTCFFSLFSSDTGIKEVLAIAIDEIGRTDTSRLTIVFNTVGKIGNKRFPSIQRINIITEDSIRYCFDPDVLTKGDASDVDYRWYLGTYRFSRDRNPCYKFGTAGTYNIVLKVEDKEGTTSIDTQIVVSKTSVSFPEIDSLTIKPKSGSAPLNVDFICTINYAYSKEIRGVNWNFGDGETKKISSHSLTEKYRYIWPGIYYPQVIVCNDAGCDTISGMVEVNGSSYLKAEPPNNGKVGEEVRFYLDGFRSRKYDYLWSIQDSTIRTNSGVLKFKFTKAGQHNVVVKGTIGRFPSKEFKKIGEMTYTVSEK